MSELRRRIKKKEGFVERETDVKTPNDETNNENLSDIKITPVGDDLSQESFWLTRVLFLRYLGFIYLIAFLISFNQNKELIGSHGLTPASNFLLNGGIFAFP